MASSPRWTSVLAWERPSVVGVFLLLVPLVCSSAGCGSTWPGVDVDGSVKAGSVPIVLGSISFLPAPGHKAPAVTGVIENGRFHIPAADGPLPGSYKVLVYLEIDPKKSAMCPPGAPKPMNVSPVRTRWETEVQIPAGAHFTCDLNLD
jgi:hypothetical protein